MTPQEAFDFLYRYYDPESECPAKIRDEAWQTLEIAVLAQQPNNSTMDAIAVVSKVAVEKCGIGSLSSLSFSSVMDRLNSTI